MIFGGENIREELLTLLKEKDIIFKHLKHLPALTSEEGQRMTSFPKEQGIKSLILRGKKTEANYLVALLGHQKIDMKALSSIVGEDCGLEDLKVIETRFGIKQGGMLPFGHFLGLSVFFDESILKLTECIIGSGVPTESIVIQVKDLLGLIQPKICKIAK